MSVRVEEFAVLADGRRLVLREDLGFSSAPRGRVGDAKEVEPWRAMTPDTIEASVLSTVLPDDPESRDAHPSAFLSSHLREQGIPAPPDELRRLRYDVVSSPRLYARLLPIRGRS